jgi:hypothetical protein
LSWPHSPFSFGGWEGCTLESKILQAIVGRLERGEEATDLINVRLRFLEIERQELDGCFSIFLTQPPFEVKQ